MTASKYEIFGNFGSRSFVSTSFSSFSRPPISSAPSDVCDRPVMAIGCRRTSGQDAGKHRQFTVSYRSRILASNPTSSHDHPIGAFTRWQMQVIEEDFPPAFPWFLNRNELPGPVMTAAQIEAATIELLNSYNPKNSDSQ